MAEITRRELLAGAAIGAAAAGAAAVGSGCEGLKRTGTVHKNAEFYGPDGKFNAEAGKKAYFELMDAFGYPITKKVRDDMWAIDFAVGRFTEVGMGGIMWLNEKEAKYFGHEIWLLPGQMIAEHAHVKTPDAEAKMEGWHLRYGGVTLFSEGPATPGAEVLIPASERPFTTCRQAQVLKPGEVGRLAKAESKHFMVAGPEGAIVTEYATYHDNAALRFTNPKIKF